MIGSAPLNLFRRRNFGGFIIAILLLAIWCEFALYYAVIYACSWPSLVNEVKNESEVLKAFFIADTHLLGPIKGHWFDKLRREWQMHRAFQTAIAIHEPEVIFFLGDLFDEGHWVDSDSFDAYVARFHTLFNVPDEIAVVVVPGNHDMGFHYELSPELNTRFNQAFNTSSVKLIKIKGSSFVLLNSMAMERDGCFLCHSSELRIRNIGERLRCEKDPMSSSRCKSFKDLSEYTRPILLQHFPMYRESDMVCKDPDAPPMEERQMRYRETWECLSRESSDLLLNKLEPRLILSGHTHHGCLVQHEVNSENYKVPEHSVPSFSWRNRKNPSFFMGVISPQQYALSKCYLPEESTIIRTYMLGGFVIAVFIMIVFCLPLSRRLFLRGKKTT